MHQMRMRSAMTAALGKRQVLIVIRVVNAVSGKWLNLFRQQVRIVWHFHPLWNLRLRLSDCMDHWILILDQRPLVALLGTVHVEALPILASRIVERTYDSSRYIGILKSHLARLDREGRIMNADHFLVDTS